MTTNALHSLYGGKVARQRLDLIREGKLALAGNVGGQERRQTVLTPKWFLQELIRESGPIIYDPCTTAYNPCKAQFFSTEKTNGLKVNWARFTNQHPGQIYENSPFKPLKEWMAKSFSEAKRGARINMLAPFRPWRTWFCKYTEGYDVLSLAPFPFVGETSAYPAPLCLILYNTSVTEIRNPRGKDMITGVWNVAT